MTQSSDAEFSDVGRSAAAPVGKPLLSARVVNLRCWLREPSRSAEGFESRVAELNHTVRKRAVAQLATLLPDVDWHEMFRRVDGSSFSAFEVPESLLELMDGMEVLDDLVRRGDMHNPRVTFARDGVPDHASAPPGVTYRPDSEYMAERIEPAQLLRALREGWTAIFNTVDQYHPGLLEFCGLLDRLSGSRSNVNCYVSIGAVPATGDGDEEGADPAEQQGFGPHWDDHDVFIFQLRGAKRWRIHPPTAFGLSRPLSPPETSEEVLWDDVLVPGMGLFIPRGWGHSVSGVPGELSVHFTISTNRARMRDVFQFAAERCQVWPVWRADLPGSPEVPLEGQLAGVVEDPDSVAASAAEVIRELSVDRTLSQLRCARRPRALPNFTDVATLLDGGGLRGSSVRSFLTAGFAIPDPDPDHEVDGSVFLAANRVMLELDPVAAELALTLLSGEEVDLNTVLDACPLGEGFVEQLLIALLEAGWVHVTRVGRS